MRGTKISEALDLYLTERVAQGEITQSTAAKYRLGVRQLIDAVGDKPIRRLDDADAKCWLEHTHAIGNQPSTRRLRWSYVNVFCEWCIDEELMTRNPFRKRKPPKPPRKAPVTLSPTEVARVLAVVPTVRDRLICMLMVQDLLRCEGVSSLRVEDIDFERRRFRVREKFDHEREVSIPDECWEVLCDYLRMWPAESGPLIRCWKKNCWNTAGMPVASARPIQPASISKMVGGWMYESGVKRGPRDGRSAHAFRRTGATDMLEHDADIAEVRDALGHASLSTTNDYIGKVAGTRLDRAMSGRRYGRPVAVGE